MSLSPILQIGDVLISSDILTEKFCCDLSQCKGQCCVEGDAGAPVTIDEIADLEDSLDAVWPHLSASAQSVIDRQGVAYTDQEGDLVTSIVGGRNCVFTYYGDIVDSDTGETITDCCLCALEKVARERAAGNTNQHSLTSQPSPLASQFVKPISCALYPIRVKTFSNGLVGLNYNRWKVCEAAVRKGQALGLPVYRFLEGPLIRRFGQEWYQELCDVARTLMLPDEP
jgi:hypothetical protein